VDFAGGKNLPDGWIPATTFWLLDNRDRAVAMSNLRHKLTPQLLNRGGHIGYYVMEPERGMGYGTQVLALTLIQARGLGLDRVLVSADSDNERSVRIIERNGGVLEDERVDETSGRPYRRYWIDLTSR
jgi:predicted acetyltransferase